MSEGCTSCGNKGGCDHRKGGMFAAIDAALAALYPTKVWGERDEEAAFGAGIAPSLAATLADRLAVRLNTLTLFRPGGPEEWCDYIYVLCFGRSPSVLEAREGVAAATGGGAWAEGTDPAHGIDELHLRIALSALAPFAAVQQVALHLARVGDDLVVTEIPRSGVFDAPLLPRFQKLVAVLAELDVRHLDFGDLTTPPVGFAPGDYGERYGGAPALVNYLFYPQPCSSITTTLLGAAGLQAGSDAQPESR